MRQKRGTAAWTLGSQNVFEAGNELPPSPMATGTDPALENDSFAAGVTQQQGAAPASEGDTRVRGQAEPGGAAYVAVENTLMAGISRWRDPSPPP